MQLIRKKRSAIYYIARLWKPFLVLAAVLLIAFNWGSISWLFNYKVAGRYITDMVENATTPKPAAKKPIVRTISKKTSAVITAASSTQAVSGKIIAVKIHHPDSVSIPSIGIAAPIVTTQTRDNDALHKLLDSGVILYPGSAAFGKEGQTVLLGHSAPAGWPKIKYDWVFTKINLLKDGDTVVVTYGDVDYYYTVSGTRVIAKGESLPSSDDGGNTLQLVSCWPPGKDYKRIVVEAELNK